MQIHTELQYIKMYMQDGSGWITHQQGWEVQGSPPQYPLQDPWEAPGPKEQALQSTAPAGLSFLFYTHLWVFPY